MTKEQKIRLLEDRYNKLSQNPKDWKCPGVVRKLARQIRVLKRNAS